MGVRRRRVWALGGSGNLFLVVLARPEMGAVGGKKQFLHVARF